MRLVKGDELLYNRKGITMEFKLEGAMSRRQFAIGAASALAAAGLAAPALADEGPDAISGASQHVDESLQLTQDQIRDLVLDYLRGWPLTTDEDGNVVYSYREMYSIATCYKDQPGLSQVEFMIDPKTMKLLGSCEKGTEKCEHIKYNPNVVMYWYHQIPEEDYVPGVNDYFNSYGVQIKGTARTLSLEDEGAAELQAPTWPPCAAPRLGTLFPRRTSRLPSRSCSSTTTGLRSRPLSTSPTRSTGASTLRTPGVLSGMTQRVPTSASPCVRSSISKRFAGLLRL